MKKLFILALCVSFAACGNDSQTETNDENVGTEQNMEASTSAEPEVEGNNQMDVDTLNHGAETGEGMDHGAE